jgi:hypothetical protein
VAKYSAGFARGLRTCADMLEAMDVDECSIVGVNGVDDVRDGRPQDNAVRRTLGRVLMRGDPEELEGFCAALTDIVATADEHGDWYRGFSYFVDTQQNTA